MGTRFLFLGFAMQEFHPVYPELTEHWQTTLQELHVKNSDSLKEMSINTSQSPEGRQRVATVRFIENSSELD